MYLIHPLFETLKLSWSPAVWHILWLMTVNVSYLSYRSYQIGFLDAELWRRCRILVAEIMWLGLLPAVNGAWRFWSHDLYLGSWNLLSPVFWVFHTAFFLPCTWWILVMPDCSCKDSKDPFVLSPRSVFLPRSSSRRPYQSCSLQMLNDAEWFRVSVVNCCQLLSISFNIYSISIYIYINIYIYVYSIFTLFNIYLCYIICIKLLTPATAWSQQGAAGRVRALWRGNLAMSFSPVVAYRSRGVGTMGFLLSLCRLDSVSDDEKIIEKHIWDILRHYEDTMKKLSAAFESLFWKWEKRWKEHVLVSRPATSWQLGRTSPARSRTLARCRVALRRSWRQSQRPSSDPNSENRNPQFQQNPQWLLDWRLK